jgi:hypothetical protein
VWVCASFFAKKGAAFIRSVTNASVKAKAEQVE